MSTRHGLIATPRVLAGLLGLLALLLGPLPVRAQSTLHAELAEVATGIKQLLDSRNEDAIGIGQFTSPPHLNASGGPAVAQALVAELKKKGLTIKLKAQLYVRGHYTDVKDKQTGMLSAHLSLEVVDRANQIVVKIDRALFGDAALASLFGATVSVPPQGTDKLRSKTLEDSLDKPYTHVQNTVISDRPDSPFAIEILVRKKGSKAAKARAVEDKEGYAFVPIAREEVYLIRVINKADHDVAVTVTIDGLNMFTFSDEKDAKTGQPLYSQMVVAAKSSYAIPGWYRTTKVTNEFKVTAYADSAAAEVRSTANLGTITVCFAAAWPKNGKPPADEPTNPGKFARSGGDATGRGNEVTVNYHIVERFFGVTRAAISVRYTK